MTDANGQPMTRPAGWGRGGATAGVFHASGSWWYLFAVSATAADTVRSDLTGLLLKWLWPGWLRSRGCTGHVRRASPTAR
jgi:hypothetical protein